MDYFTPQTDPKIDFTKVSPSALSKLNATREMLGMPMKVSSSYRTPEQSVAVGGLNNDAHQEEPCTAFDVEYPDHGYRARLIYAAHSAGFERIGINEQNGHVHLDDSPVLPRPAFWIEKPKPQGA